MDHIDRETLVELARHRGWPSVSVYLPAHRSPADREQDRIRAKNLLNQACEELVSQGVREPDAEAHCAPIAAAFADDTFWRDGSDGIAAFASADHSLVLRVDTPMPEQVTVGDRYSVRPLLLAWHDGVGFFALTVDKNGSNLFRCDRVGIEPVALEGAPASLADELKYDVYDEDQQLQTFASPESIAGAGRTVGMFHGHGGEKDVETQNLTRYLRKIAKAVDAALAASGDRPLVLLGVEYELALFRELSTYAAIASTQVLGSPVRYSDHEIHAKALAALSPGMHPTIEADLAEYEEKQGTQLASDDATEIAAAAAAGRVKTLMLDDGVGPFGTFDRDTLTATAVCDGSPRLLRESAPPQTPESGQCGWDLADLAAAETILNGGTVWAFSGEGAPIDGVHAVFRY